MCLWFYIIVQVSLWRSALSAGVVTQFRTCCGSYPANLLRTILRICPASFHNTLWDMIRESCTDALVLRLRQGLTQHDDKNGYVGSCEQLIFLLRDLPRSESLLPSYAGVDPDTLTGVATKDTLVRCHRAGCDRTMALTSSSDTIKSLMKCGRCHQVSYCCRQHQTDDWSEHKPNCIASSVGSV